MPKGEVQNFYGVKLKQFGFNEPSEPITPGRQVPRPHVSPGSLDSIA
jgi:hypothetical protein